VVAFFLPEVVGCVGLVYKMLDGVPFADPGENPRFRSLVGVGDGDVSYVLEGIIEVKLTAPSTAL
jgi:hypothetical protein